MFKDSIGHFGFVYQFVVKRLVDPRLLENYMNLRSKNLLEEAALFHQRFSVSVADWQTVNLITNVGKNEILDSIFAANGGTHYFGLTDGTPTVAAADTMSSHAGWVEIGNGGGADEYDETTRPAMSMAAAASQSKSTSSAATFTMNEDKTVGGSFVCDDSTKGGSSGILLSVAAFSGGDRSLLDNDVLNMSATFTAS